MRMLRMTIEPTPEVVYLTCDACGYTRKLALMATSQRVVLNLGDVKSCPRTGPYSGNVPAGQPVTTFLAQDLPDTPNQALQPTSSPTCSCCSGISSVHTFLVGCKLAHAFPINPSYSCPACRGRHRPHTRTGDCIRNPEHISPPSLDGHLPQPASVLTP